jgi:hypothetical protein
VIRVGDWDALGGRDAPDALSGVDGTQLPDPLPVFADALTGSQPDPWQDIPTEPPVPVAPVLDVRAMQEAINAALGAAPAGPVHPPPAATPAGPLPGRAPGRPPPGGAMGGVPRRRPVVPQPVPPIGSLGTGRPVPRRPQVPVPARAFAPARALPPADLRRRIVRDFPSAPQARSAAGTRTGCVVALVVLCVVLLCVIVFGMGVFTVAAGIVQSPSVLFP